MALQPCRECGKPISSDANSCPGCGAPCSTTKPSRGFGFEWKTKTRIFRLPLVHVAIGLDARGRPLTAKGFIAIGQVGIGVITIAQAGLGLLFGFGQLVFGLIAIGQAAVGLVLAVGQFAVGILAVGQQVIGVYGLCQAGWAKYLWSTSHTDMEAVALFYTIYEKLGRLIGL
ncbi:MAG: hypothetical protein RDU20_08985 [Desulfomonilaceae bacterium]|nr:hypothetical protein [Desulfomonilaceae bacterium]